MTNKKNPIKNIEDTNYWNKVTAGWKPYIEKPVALEDLDEIMVGASIPSFGYFFMLLLSAVIATFGLLSNSAPAIIGAMIIAPLMGPIISLAYSIDIFDWRLARRSFLTVTIGVLLVIVFSYLSTRVIGLRIAGSEILSRTSPTLLDLGVAMAAGAAAAFSYTRKSIINSIAGVAIAVALVPPLAVTGIGLAYGRLATSEVGLSLTELGLYSGGTDIAKGSFVLFATNFLGIIFVACIILLTQGYGKWKKAGIGLLAVLIASIVIVDPLEKALYKLTVKSDVLALMVSLPNNYPHMFTGQGRIDAVNVNYHGDTLYVHIAGIAPRPKSDMSYEEMNENLQSVLDLFQDHLEEKLNSPVIVELDVIPVELISVSSGGEQLDPVGYEEPDKEESPEPNALINDKK
jgi:uncharacterized hydrophobic protein (TIGR00271 family)